MKQVVSDKYSVAWFKIADCIARGEKERALGVYRLLSHSFEDPAMACQLHADILLSFQDKKFALDKYKEAANLYQENGRILEAAAVHEHLVILEPDVIAHRMQLIELYQQLHIASKVRHYVNDLVEYLLSVNEWTHAIEAVCQFDSVGDAELTGQLNANLVIGLLDNVHVLADTKAAHAQKAVSAWFQAGNERAIEDFLTTLKARDQKLYQYSVAYKGDLEK